MLYLRYSARGSVNRDNTNGSGGYMGTGFQSTGTSDSCYARGREEICRRDTTRMHAQR